MPYEPLGFDTPDEFERALLEQWRSEDLFHRTLEATADGEPFVFYEGPPTANGRPGIHHVFARTIKDMVCRYHAMLGQRVTRIAGWDTHGLPVEIEVEKALNISGKADIERFGVAAFNEQCKESVFRYKSDWESLSERIGYWLDYSRPYITYTNEYIESVWWLLKQLHDRDLLYQGHKVLPYCPRCGTALSSHELAQGYETHRSPSIHVLFRLVGEAERYLLVWTTTPWTLPSNVAVAVHPDFRYVEHEVDGRRIIVEKVIAEQQVIPGATQGKPVAAYPRVAEYQGRDLVGQRYEQLLDAVAVDQEHAFRVVPGDFVTNEEGTGLVHMAPAFGADDYATGRRERLAFVNPVDAEGRFTDTAWDAINGKTVFEANPIIADRLVREGKVFGRYQPEGYEHSYPFCWRCDSPLIYYARQSWFVRTTAFQDRMIAINRDVEWYPPEVGEGRFGEWLENNVDWALSRDRYWGTPLPVWVCDRISEHRVAIGSYRELEERWGKALPADFDPHKPFIDEYTFPCSAAGCGGTMQRIPEVIDAWFDSGAMPYAQWHHPFENDQEFQQHFPADFICEGLDQTRGWFYSLLAITAGVSDSPAYHHCVVNGLVLDADGRKMSKRLGNVADPWEAVRQFGADAVRIYLLASSQVWLEKRFDPSAIREVASAFLNRLRNAYGFFALYAEDWTPETAPPAAERPLVDRWLLSRLDAVTAAVRRAWSAYDVTGGVRTIVDFCDHELSNWYVRVSRSRFWAPDASADPAALATLHEALAGVARLLAPAAPFLSDAIHRRLTGVSVHLAGFPDQQGRRDQVLDAAMVAVRRLASLARAAREHAGLRVRQPIARMRVAVPAAVQGPAFESFLDVLASEVNVKEIEVVASDTELVRLKPKPNYRTLGKVYGSRTPLAATSTSELTQEQLGQLEGGVAVTIVASTGDTFDYRPEDVVVEREVVTDWLVQSDGPLVVALDPQLTEELRREGMAREVVNRVQRLRKEAGYDYNTRIELSISGADDVLAATGAFRRFVVGETLARRLEAGSDLANPDVRETVDIDGRRVVISLRRHDGAGG
ncbi:MAG: isoleucine--tRNA ligase [Gemmatimonadales bacterium]|nr:isoleucine--tRNA ligase [Gemmatimonadales bacterium]NIN11335.1 isoleucine--tRNA ligase [Gemmatimonadales bacterium]NIN49945.1 isoleucine--tRNA ligase [Gemmatimonadales bacterium]NIP07409.1 isoleucine--tRNA ligase [Gemmatimonadales bacterium]NIR00476.1 isoleucine--tRNA ligase [Gemmatimonadales bacterium]